MSTGTNWANRIKELPPYLFAEIDKIKRKLREEGKDVIDLSIGDPDLPTPDPIIQTLAEAAKNPANHHYPSYAGSSAFRKAVSLWYEDRFCVSLNPDTEVVALVGSKEGIAHMPLAFVNPGDAVLVPNPGYPVYRTASSFAGGVPYDLPLKDEEQFLPKPDRVPPDIAEKTKMMFINYPNNPTSATIDRSHFEQIVHFAERYNILVCHDAAYTEVGFGGYEPLSFLQVRGARDVGVEFHSLSKTFNMTGWRIGFAVGNRDAIAGLSKIKTNIDSGVFGAVQEAGITALENWKKLRDANNRIYEHRRDMVAERLRALNIGFQLPKASFYMWCAHRTNQTSAEFCAKLLSESGVCFTPGTGFGSLGEGFFRISLTASEVRLQEALSRVEQALAR